MNTMPELTIINGDGVVLATFESPVLTRAVLRRLTEALNELAAAAEPQPVVLRSTHPSIFLAGADLSEIAELDVSSCSAYADLGRLAARTLATHPAPVVAAVAGSCSGGGFDLVMSCDAVVASPDSVFRHPGVHRGLVTGWGGTTRIGRALDTAGFCRAFLNGEGIDGGTMLKLGLVERLADDPVSEGCRSARRMARLDPSRIAVWRRFKDADFIDRFRAFVVESS